MSGLYARARLPTYLLASLQHLPEDVIRVEDQARAALLPGVRHLDMMLQHDAHALGAVVACTHHVAASCCSLSARYYSS